MSLIQEPIDFDEIDNRIVKRKQDLALKRIEAVQAAGGSFKKVDRTPRPAAKTNKKDKS